jgi:hypothetical protein
MVFSPSRTQTMTVSIDVDLKRTGILTSWVERFLVWLIRSVWVANWCHEIILLLEDIISDTTEVSELHIGVKVHLDNTVGDGLLELCLGRSGSTVEDQEDWLIFLSSDVVLDIFLVLAEKLWVELDVTRLVDTVNITESSGNGEVWGDR